jgi:uridine phosphorylase
MLKKLADFGKNVHHIGFRSDVRSNVPVIGVAPIVVLSWSHKVIRSLADEVGAQRSLHWFYDDDHIAFSLYTGKVQDSRVSFALYPEGAPATVLMMEEMIACGARIFIGVGQGGSLQPSAPIGTLLVPTSCVSEEGTSEHYLEAMHPLAPDPSLVELLRSAAQSVGASVLTGSHWTTDAPYREPLEKLGFTESRAC